MKGLDERFKKINDLYTDFVYMHYERRRAGGQYKKKDTDKQAGKLINSFKVYKKM